MALTRRPAALPRFRAPFTMATRRPATVQGMKVALLSPHFDDAVLSCWHVLSGPADVTVINVFTASPPGGTPAASWDRLTGAQDPVERMCERREEDRRALALVGRDAVNLDLLDAQYRGGHVPADALVGRLQAVLETGTLVWAPAGLSRHPDHEAVRDAALELAGSGCRVAIYADLPHGIRRGWPAWVSGGPELPGFDVGGEWSAVLADAGLDVERLVPRVRPLDAHTRDRKLRALTAYGTQRAALDGLAFVALEDPRALAFEVSWAVPDSALGRFHESRGEPLVADARRESLHDGG